MQQQLHIDDLLANAFHMNASDLHITTGAMPVYRIHGELTQHGNFQLTEEMTKEMAKHLIGTKNWPTFIEAGEIDFSYHLQGVARFRINIFKQKDQISLAARVIPVSIPSLDQLNMPPILKQLAKRPQGLILVTGPTGSGKTTTLAAMIDLINKEEAKHIITLEDPIEYIHHHQKSIIHQREVGSDTQSFANGLRASLRQDPDIILVGEMRDLETIATAITAAETGHLVLATLHTNSAPQTINRIIDVFPPNQQGQIRLQLAAVLAGIISQRLIPKQDKNGRVAATEILINQPAIANLIRNQKVSQVKNMLQTGRAQGMHTLEMSINELVQNGIIDPNYANEMQFV